MFIVSIVSIGCLDALDGSCHNLPEFNASLTLFDVFLASYSGENL